MQRDPSEERFVGVNKDVSKSYRVRLENPPAVATAEDNPNDAAEIHRLGGGGNHQRGGQSSFVESFVAALLRVGTAGRLLVGARASGGCDQT